MTVHRINVVLPTGVGAVYSARVKRRTCSISSICLHAISEGKKRFVRLIFEEQAGSKKLPHLALDLDPDSAMQLADRLLEQYDLLTGE